LALLVASPCIIALLIAIVAHTHSNNLYDSFGVTQQVLFAMVCASIFMGLFNTMQEVCSEGSIIKREHLAGLRISAYILSKMTVHLVISFVQGFVFTIMCSILFGLPDESFFQVVKVVILTTFTASALGLFISSSVKTNARAMLVAPLVLIVQLLFAGAILRMEGLARIISFTTISHWASRLLGIIARLNDMDDARNMREHYLNYRYDYNFLERIERLYYIPEVQWIMGGGLDPMYDPSFHNYMGSMGVLMLFCVICGIGSVVVLKLQVSKQ